MAVYLQSGLKHVAPQLSQCLHTNIHKTQPNKISTLFFTKKELISLNVFSTELYSATGHTTHVAYVTTNEENLLLKMMNFIT